MVRPVGIEPTTNGFEIRYSIQLSYGRIKISIENFVRMYNQLKEYTNFTKFTKIVFLQNTYLNFLTKSALLR